MTRDRSVVKYVMLRIHQVFCFLLFDPIEVLNKLRGVPYYLSNRKKYIRLNKHPNFDFRWKEVLPVLHDRFRQAGSVRNHYFWQDLWAARLLHAEHVNLFWTVIPEIAHIWPRA